jgi:hypothetical protein
MKWSLKWDLGNKIAMFAILPIMAMSIVAIKISVEKFSQIQKIDNFIDNIQSIKFSFSLIRELQKERSKTYSFLIGGNRYVPWVLNKQREITNLKLDDYLSKISTLKYSNSNLEKSIQKTQKINEQIETLRNRIDLTSFEAKTARVLFKELIEQITELIRSLSTEAPTSEIRNQLDAYLALLYAIDSAQLESDNLEIASDYNSNYLINIQNFNELSDREYNNLKDFNNLAQPKIKQKYFVFSTSTFNKILLELRERNSDSSLMYLDKNKEIWLDISNLRINSLQNLQEDQLLAIINLAISESNRAKIDFGINIFLSTITIGLSFYLFLFVNQKLIIPLKEINKAIAELSRGNFSPNIKKLSKNELGEVITEFNNLARIVQLFTQEITNSNKALRSDNYKIVNDRQYFQGVWQESLESIDATVQKFAILDRQFKKNIRKQHTAEQLTENILQNLALPEILDLTTASIFECLNCSLCEIFLLQLDAQHLIRKSAAGFLPASQEILLPDLIDLANGDKCNFISPLYDSYTQAIAATIGTEEAYFGFLIVHERLGDNLDKDDLPWLRTIANIVANGIFSKIPNLNNQKLHLKSRKNSFSFDKER